MKKPLLFILALMMVFGAQAQESAKRYGIKSGILHLMASTGGHETEETQYFDDYGAMEALVFTIDVPGLVKYDTYTVTKGEKAWMFTDTEGKKSKAKAFDNPTPDLNFLNLTPEAAEKYKVKELGHEDVLGYDCTKYTYEIMQGRKTCYWTAWVYKGVILKSITKIGRQESTIEATRFEKNVTVPAKVFEIPK